MIEYRKWLDKFGSSLPFYQGYSTSKNVESDRECNAVLPDRFSRHTLICSSCNRAYQVTNRLKQSLVGVAIALFAFAIIADGSTMPIAAGAASLLSVVMAMVAQKIKTHFERSYTRH